MTNKILCLAVGAGLGLMNIRAADAQAAIWTFPQDAEMAAVVKRMIGMIGLRNEIIVVIEPGATGCAYATTVRGLQYISVDPTCVGPIKTRSGAYNWRALNILAHEVGHHLNGHTTNQKEDNPAEETAADEWSGFAMYQMKATLEQAQTFMRTTSVDVGKAHPGRATRLASIARGWNQAKDGGMPARVHRIEETWWEDLMKTPLPWRDPEDGPSTRP